MAERATSYKRWWSAAGGSRAASYEAGAWGRGLEGAIGGWSSKWRATGGWVAVSHWHKDSCAGLLVFNKCIEL